MECSMLDRIGLCKTFFFVKRKRMDYVIKPTLQHLSLAKIAVQLWIQKDFLKLENEFQNKLEVQVLVDVQNLAIPNQLKKELEYFIKPIGLLLFKWFKYLYKNYHLFQVRPKVICWTPFGTIDTVKSIKKIFMEQRLGLEKRFELACDYCLVDEIESSWKEMTDEDKLQQEKWCDLHDHLPVRQYWVNYLLGKTDDLRSARRKELNLSPYHDGCSRAMLNHNGSAVQYFFEKLSSKEKELILSDVRTWLRCDYNEVDNEPVCFLLSQINENQQAENLLKMPEIVLRCLLSWPYQGFFLETAKRVFEFLNTCDFEIILIRIIDKIVTCSTEYRYIFLDFWRSSPDKLKKSIIRPDHFPWQELYNCFEKGEEICKMISNNGNVYKKKLLLLIGDMKVNLTIHSRKKIELLKVSYRKNAESQKILYDRYQNLNDFQINLIQIQ